MASLQEVKRDLAAVEQLLLAFVAQACPDNESRASGLDAARCLIDYAQTSTPDEDLCLSSTHEQPELRAYPPEVLRSCSALQPLLGQTGALDALKVLRALRCRMQRLEASPASQPKPFAHSGEHGCAVSHAPQGESSASIPSAALALASTALERKGAVAQMTDGAGCHPDMFQTSAVSRSAQQTTCMSSDRRHDASGSSEQTAQADWQLQTPEKLDTAHRKQLPDTAVGPLQCTAKVRT